MNIKQIWAFLFCRNKNRLLALEAAAETEFSEMKRMTRRLQSIDYYDTPRRVGSSGRMRSVGAIALCGSESKQRT